MNKKIITKTRKIMSNKEKINKAIDLIEKMEQNTFLLPDSWSDTINMVSRSAHYRTYVGARGQNRYINIEYVKNNELYNPKKEDCYYIEIRKNNIYIKKRLGEKRNDINLVCDIIMSIYKEKISFEIMDKEVVKKRLELKILKEEIKQKTQVFYKIKEELSNFKNK